MQVGNYRNIENSFRSTDIPNINSKREEIPKKVPGIQPGDVVLYVSLTLWPDDQLNCLVTSSRIFFV
jgi:hypothetical protein